jgi:LPXTG-site transpeptidase (sortase) family protein
VILPRRRNKAISLTAIIVAIGITIFLSAYLLIGTGTKTESPALVGTVNKKPSAVALVPLPTIHRYGLPVRLIIPKIAVDAPVQDMGLTQTGNLQAPATNNAVGWYKNGSRPGNSGSAVIDGHLGLGSTSAVFTELRRLQKGDTVMVVDDHGSTASFVVRQSKLFDKDTQPTEVFSSLTGSHLNLITCNGDWEQQQKTYSMRLVVFADSV